MCFSPTEAGSCYLESILNREDGELSYRLQTQVSEWMAQVSSSPAQWLTETGLLFPSGLDALRTAYLPNQFKPFPLRPLILFPQLRGNRMLVTLSRSH